MGIGWNPTQSMFRQVHHSFLKAHQIIWQQGYWRFLLVPIGLSFVLAVILLASSGYVAAGLSGSLHEWISESVRLWGWLQAVLGLALFVLLLLPCYLLFRGLVMLCYAPFLDRISMGTEKLVGSPILDSDMSFLKSLKRPALMAALTLCGMAVVMLLALLAGFIPLVGAVISIILVFPVNLLLSTLSYLDPYLERRSYSPVGSIKRIWQHRWPAMYFGLIGFLITTIPIFGWFVGPTYSVVGGIVLAISITDGAEKQRITD
jgi:uncharacterized protein involved in cysteine biosynthesis